MEPPPATKTRPIAIQQLPAKKVGGFFYYLLTGAVSPAPTFDGYAKSTRGPFDFATSRQRFPRHGYGFDLKIGSESANVLPLGAISKRLPISRFRVPLK